MQPRMIRPRSQKVHRHMDFLSPFAIIFHQFIPCKTYYVKGHIKKIPAQIEPVHRSKTLVAGKLSGNYQGRLRQLFHYA